MMSADFINDNIIIIIISIIGLNGNAFLRFADIPK